MEMEGSQKIDLEVEDDGLIDNNRFSENQVGFDTHDLAGAANAEKQADCTLGDDANDHLPELHESTEPAQPQRNGRYNLRKSLAWDSAFFTSAGVLDPEELSSMIIGPEKAEKHFLPGIQEEITGSTESISTLTSDNLTLETLEDDLFVDIRASIQRSSKKAMNLANSSSKAAAIDVDSAAVSSLRKEEVASQNKNPKPGLKKSCGLQTIRMSKSQPKQNIGKLGSAKAIKHDSGHSQMSSKIGETNSLLLRPPKTTSTSIPSAMTSKRDSTGTGHVKSECGNSKLGAAATGKGTQASKVSVLSGARRVLPKPAVSSKSSLLGSLTKSGVQSVRSSTSSDNSSKLSSGTPTKSTLATPRRNPGKSSNVCTGPSSSIPRTPSKAALKNKPPSSTLSTYLTSTKISSNVSPASSISGWSSASSTSSVVLNNRSNNPRASLDTSSHRSTDGDTILLDPRNHSADPTTGRHENQLTNLTTGNARKTSTQTGALQAPVKPSGLRMPSPKIGFFDGVKSSGRTPNGQQQSQSGLRPLLPKNGTATCSPKQSSNSKVKSAKVQTARTGTTLARTKPSSPKAKSPASSQEKSHALGNTSGVPTDVKYSPGLSLGAKANVTGESCPEAEEVQAEDGVKQVVDAGTGTIIKENLGDLNMQKKMSIEDIKIASVEGGNAPGSEIIDQTDTLVNQNHLKTESHPICEAADKENSHINYQGGMLT